MFGVFINYGHGEKCVYKNSDLTLVMRKQAEYVKKAKFADRNGKQHSIISCRFGIIREEDLLCKTE